MDKNNIKKPITAARKRHYWHFSSLNLLMLIVGGVCLVAGFLLLYLVDARAENTWGIVSPLLLVAAYIFIFLALLVEHND